MKKAYATLTAEKLEFQYEKVVAAYSGNCGNTWSNTGDNCDSFENVRNFASAS